MAGPQIVQTRCPSCGASLSVPPGLPQLTCRYCNNVIHVEHKKPPPNVAQFAPRTVYIDPNAAAAGARKLGIVIALTAILPLLIPILIGVGPWGVKSCKGKMKPFPVSCGTNEEVEVTGNWEGAGPIVTSVGHNCKLHIKNAKLKGATLVKTETFNMELTLENATIETTDTMIHTGSNLKLKVHGGSLTSSTTVVDSDTNLESEVEDATIEGKNGVAIKTKHNLKLRLSNAKIRGKKAALDTDANLEVTMKKNSEITSSEGPGVKTTSSFKLEAEGGKIDGAGGAILATSSLALTATGFTLNGNKEKAIAATSSLKIDLTDSSVTSLEAEAIEGDSSVELLLANTKVQGNEIAISTKSSSKIKATKKSRIAAPNGYGVLTSSNSEITLNDAAIEAGAKAFKGTVNNKVKLQAGARVSGKKGGIESEGNFELDATGAVIEGGTGAGIQAGYNARISLKQGSLKGTPALQFERKPSSLEISGTAITGDQKIPAR